MTRLLFTTNNGVILSGSPKTAVEREKLVFQSVWLVKCFYFLPLTLSALAMLSAFVMSLFKVSYSYFSYNVLQRQNMLCSPLGTLYLFFSCFAVLLLEDKGQHDRKHGICLLLV